MEEEEEQKEDDAVNDMIIIKLNSSLTESNSDKKNCLMMFRDIIATY
jgi:hypothetical protein